MKRDKAVIENNTVFLLRIRYANDAVKYPARLRTSIFGVFTNLQRAEHFLKIKNKKLFNFLEDKPFKIYEIEEIALNYFWNFIRTRFYNHAGEYYRQHIWEEDITTFDSRFKRGDLVEFIDGSVLHAGIVAETPPDKYSSPFKDYYLVLHGLKEYGCFRAVSHHVFSLSGKINDTYKARLIKRLEKEPLSRLKKEIESKSDFTAYRIIE